MAQSDVARGKDAGREELTDAVVTTRKGQVWGGVTDGVARFLSIPYAAAPVGPHRFAKPAPVDPWDGVRDARAFGPTPPKLPYRGPLSDLLVDTAIEGDEWLNLNVWTPDPAASGLPVMVWVHGGSLRNGSSSQPGYDGANFARDGVVLVSINYRLGVEGFAQFPDAPANRGLLDVIAALEWVRDEIAAFGGDPDNVTVFGQSAGANLVAGLLGAPRARGLFRRAVLQSGPTMLVTPKQALRTTALIAKKLGVPPTAAAFAAVDPAELLAAQGAVTSSANPVLGAVGFGLVSDPDSVPTQPIEAIRSGAVGAVDLLIGSTTHEHRLWFVPTKVNEKITPLIYRLALWKAKVPRAARAEFRSARPGEPLGEVLGAIATDSLIRVPLHTAADAHSGRAFVYEFGWESGIPDLAACHGLELGFVFDNLHTEEAQLLTGVNPPQALADRMHRAWIDFATTGDPGWQQWDETRPVQYFDGDGARIVYAPREAERASVA